MFPVCVCASVFVQPHPEFQVQTSQPDVLLGAKALQSCRRLQPQSTDQVN